MLIKYLSKILLYLVTGLFVIYLVANRYSDGPPLLKKAQISHRARKINYDYGLVNYSLESHCKGSISCFIKYIPEPTKSKYDRIGDLLYGMESGRVKSWRNIAKQILACDRHKKKFVTRYFDSLGWLAGSTSSKELLKPIFYYKHDWKQAKKVLLTFRDQYNSAQDTEIVIYVRAGDKLLENKNMSCLRAKGIGGCNTIFASYADYIEREARQISKNNPEINKITIVTARRGSVASDRESMLFTDIIQKLKPITSNIWLHSSNDLDEDIFYMGTAKHLIAHKDIGNLSYVVKEIQAAKIMS